MDVRGQQRATGDKSGSALRFLTSFRRTALVLAIIAFSALAGFLGVSAKLIDSLRIGGPQYQVLARAKRLEADILPPPLYLVDAYLLVRQANTAPARTMPNFVAQFERLARNYRETESWWTQQPLAPHTHHQLLVVSHDAATEFLRLATAEYFPALAASQPAQAAAVLARMDREFNLHRRAVDLVVTDVRSQAVALENSAPATVRQSLVVLAGLFVLTATLLLALGTWFLRRLLGRVDEVVLAANSVASGELQVPIDTRGADELAPGLRALESMRHQLLESGAARDVAMDHLTRANTHLHQAMEQLARNEKFSALGSLVAGIAHEMNTPLSNSLVVANTLEAEVATFRAAVETNALGRRQLHDFIERCATASGIMARSAQRAAELIASFKQVAVDQTSARRRRFFLNEVVNHTVAAVMPRHRGKPVAVEQRLAPGIEMDSFPGPLEQVIGNLIDNAIVHGLGARPQLQIAIEAEAAELHGRAAVRVIVQDDGDGIPDEVAGRVFEAFYTTKHGEGGSGLGLHLVQALVTETLGGTITLSSTQGAGTRFEILLPLDAPLASADATPASQTV